MKLTAEKRTTGTKGELSKIRREGGIPAILYGMGKVGTPIHVRKDEIQEILRNIASGHLATTIFEIKTGTEGKRAVIKDVQYHVANYDIEHIDFLEIKDDHKITVNVPIKIVGAADCAGVKLGGFLRQVIRSLKVSCFPKDLPESFLIDVRSLGIGGSKTLGDLDIPETVKPLVKLTEVALVIGKKAGT